MLVRHCLGHTAGLPGWDARITMDDLYDWEKCTSLLAAQAPWWEPGTASGYHGITQGYLVGEVIRRITGQTVGTFFAREIAGPLGADFHIGVEARARPPDRRVHPAGRARNAGGGPDSMGMRLHDNPPLPRERWGEEGLAARRNPGRQRLRQRPRRGADQCRCWPAAARPAASG